MLWYRREGRKADDTDIAELFTLFKSQMDEEARQYEEMCKRNRINGSKHTKKEPSGTQWHPVGSDKEKETEKEKRTKKDKR